MANQPEALINWLQLHDEWAATLSPNDDLGPFLFTRARLEARRQQEPAQDSAVSVDQSEENVEENAFRRILEAYRKRRTATIQETFAKWEAKIAAHAAARRAIDDLNPDLRHQLAAMVHDTVTAFEIYTERKEFVTRAKTLAAEGDRRGRKLGTKVQAAKSALVRLRDYASNLDPQIGEPYSRTAAWCLAQLDPLVAPLSSARWQEIHAGFKDSRKHHPVPDDPTSLNMVQLYWFFRHGCGVNGDESEVRAALIRNAFWDRWVDPVTIVPRYTGSESVGCGAVHVAVHRFRP